MNGKELENEFKNSVTKILRIHEQTFDVLAKKIDELEKKMERIIETDNNPWK